MHSKIFIVTVSWIIVNLHRSNLAERLAEHLARHTDCTNFSSRANRRWIINCSWFNIDTTETISWWAEKFSMQMIRMKSVWQNDTEQHRKMSYLQRLKSRFRQCWAKHMHILSIKSLSRQHQLMSKIQSSWIRWDCSIVTSQTSAEDVIRSLATASRYSFIDDTVENTIRMMWDICLIDLDAQTIALSRLHLACALVMMMMITQQFVNKSCHANEVRNRRSAIGRKQKNAEKERQKDQESL